MTNDADEKKKNVLCALATVIFFVLACLFIWLLVWNMNMQNLMKDLKQENELTKIRMDVLSDTLQGDVKGEMYWQCIEWYGSCNEFVFDNQTGMFIPDGYLDPGCEGACKDYSLHKLRELPKVAACGNEVCETDLGETAEVCPEDCEVVG